MYVYVRIYACIYDIFIIICKYLHTVYLYIYIAYKDVVYLHLISAVPNMLVLHCPFVLRKSCKGMTCI